VRRKNYFNVKNEIAHYIFFVVKGYVFTNINLFVNVNVSGMLQEENL